MKDARCEFPFCRESEAARPAELNKVAEASFNCRETDGSASEEVNGVPIDEQNR